MLIAREVSIACRMGVEVFLKSFLFSLRKFPYFLYYITLKFILVLR